jgi:hypothetical protein
MLFQVLDGLGLSDPDTLRHPLKQANVRLNKRHALSVRDLKPFTGAMTLASFSTSLCVENNESTDRFLRTS